MRSLEWRARPCVLVALAAAVAVADGNTCQIDPHKPSGKCVSYPETCPENYIPVEGQSVYGLCPKCIQTLGEGDICEEGKTRPCPEHYICEGGKCVKGACRKEQDKDHETWTPSCDRLGNFEPVQCKGSKGSEGGRCFCWSPKGQRLFGEAAWTDLTEKIMHCECSLRAWQLKENGAAEHELPRCAFDGSFEALQCARGVCWCADGMTGQPIRRVVPEGAAHKLFCYKADDVGATYRRRCDSQAEARGRIQELMEAHGTSAHGLPNAYCDLDGSFGPVQDGESGARFCALKDKQRIEPHVDNGNTDMNCNCARDSKLSGSKLECVENGNYKPQQREGDDFYCVDEDGYFIKTANRTDTCTR